MINIVTLLELDEIWKTDNLDAKQLKYLCRKYNPLTVVDWINRGMAIHDKEKVIVWHKAKLEELGQPVIEKPKEIKDERLFSDDVGDYFED